MDKKRLPVWSLIKEIKDNNYYKQSKLKSRIEKDWRNETEVEGSVATERVVTQIDSQPPNKQGANIAHISHRRKQSANIPYKMTIPHTNIGRLWNIDKIDCNSETNHEIEYDEDEECNIGGEAEESVDHNWGKAQLQYYPHRVMGSSDRHFRSSTTRSGPNSLDQYKQSDGPFHNGFSSEDDDDNFLTLECDENLFDEEPLNRHIEEEEKVLIHPTKVKQSFVDLQNKNTKPQEKRVWKETVNDDTIPDFGFIGKEGPKAVEKLNQKSKENKVMNEKQDKKSSQPKKLKIKCNK